MLNKFQKMTTRMMKMMRMIRKMKNLTMKMEKRKRKKFHLQSVVNLQADIAISKLTFT